MEVKPQQNVLAHSAEDMEWLMRLPRFSGPLNRPAGSEKTEDEFILIKKDALEELLLSNLALVKNQQALMDLIQDIPEISRIRLDDGLNMTEWRLLARHKDSILQEVRKLQ